ncbi:MAG: hypothetical protein AAGG57_06785 [Pseudomonadota bacterium]
MKLICAIAAFLFMSSCQEETNTSVDVLGAAERMMQLVSESNRFSKVPQQCPLAVYETRSNIPSPVPECSVNPGGCLSLCATGNRDACFDAARTIEKGDIVEDTHRTFPLFMASCALGSANSCVNAGAAVKNGVWPVSTPPPKAAGTAKCQFQTYNRMCEEGAAWGCYMVAQEYRRSDGFRAESEADYEANMRRACQLNPDSGACLDQFK